MHRRQPERTALFAVFAAVVALGSVACADSAEPAADVVLTRSDSAGVEIVVISGRREAIPVVATFDTSPELRLGSPMGQAAEQFGVIRDVIATSDGGIAVLDGQAAEVRLFDAAGRSRAILGGRGEGPGEFQSPMELAALPGETLAVFDPRPGRITRFGPDGTMAGVTTLDGVETRVTDARFLMDGSLVGQSHWLSPNDGPPPTGEPTFIRNSAVLTLFDDRGQVVDTIDVVPSGEEIVSIQVSSTAVSVLKRPAAYARDNVFAPTPAGTWSAENDRFELKLRETATGRLLRIVRAPLLELPTTPELAQAIRDEAVREAETPEERSRLETWLDLSPRPELQPAFDAFEADEQGRLWVREWTPFHDATRWWVFEPDGALLGSLDAPSGLTITQVTCTSVLGVERDELEIDYAVRYALHGSVRC